MALSFLDLGNKLGTVELTLLHYFAKDTTERILHNIARLGITHDGALSRSIHTTVYNNASGNDALVRFYYLNYGRYLQHALGSYWGVDEDLSKLSSSGIKRKGVKRRNVDVAEMTSMEPIKPSLSGLPSNKSRERTHIAYPFLDSEIRLHLRSVQKRLAILLGFTASAYLLHGMVKAFASLKAPDKRTVRGRQDYQDRVTEALASHGIDRSDASIDKANREAYAPVITFEPDFDFEEAWLQAKGYMQHIQRDWGLSSFNIDNIH